MIGSTTATGTTAKSAIPGKTTIVRRIAAGTPRPMPADDLRRVAAVGAVSAIIDVRSPAAFASRHIAASINIPEAKITALVHALTAHPGAVLVCEDGRRSCEVARAVGIAGFPGVFYLEGGLTAWDGAGGPLDETTGSGAERRVGRKERGSFLLSLVWPLTFQVVFVGLAASAACIALALSFF